MPTLDPRIDAYIERAAPFAQPILKHVRKLVHKAVPEIVETIKWGMPAFEYKGPLAGMAAFKQHCTFGFWKAKLIVGEDRDVESTAMGSFGRITSRKDLPSDKVLLEYLKKARELNEAGIKVAKPKPKTKEQKVVDVPDYFLRALRTNKKALQAFEAFSYSHRKEYVEWITEAKREETRAKRIETALEWLAEGKSRNWKYEKC